MNEAKNIKIIIADDDYFARKGLETVLENILSVKKIAHAENGKQVIALLEKEFYNIVFMDLKMPELDGFQTATLIHERFKKVNVIVFTLHSTDEMLFEMFDRGAMGYVLKTDNETRVGEAIATVMAGDYYFADSGNRIMNHLNAEALKKTWGRTNDKLTEPETEVLIRICEEMCLKEIAALMNISEPKVKYHHSRLLFKTGARNTAGLVRYAIREGIYIETIFANVRRYSRIA